MLELFKGIFCARSAWNAYNVGRYRDTGKLK